MGTSQPIRIIATKTDLARSLARLLTLEPRFAHALEVAGNPPLRRAPEGYAQIFSAIVSQQISTSAADAIWARLREAGLTTQDAVRQANEQDLQACGLSRPKARYGRALAEAAIDYDALHTMPDAEVMATLTAVTGIGPWTAQIYLLSSLGRADVFPQADVALQAAAQMLFALSTRPTSRQMDLMAKAWSPERTVAAHLLWAYYRHHKGREGIR